MSAESPADSVPKSKQERIRDNQRRSRARRQEYLADLERRLAECQVTCREADLQRAASLELQIENARLRELLSLAGVSDDLVDNYVSRAVSQAGQFSQQNHPNLRQLKPNVKFAPTDAHSGVPTAGPSFSSPSMGGSLNLPPVLPSSISRSGSIIEDLRPPVCHPQNPEMMLPTAQMPLPETNLSWPSSNEILKSNCLPQDVNSNFTCDAFGFSTDQRPGTPDENTVLCSVAQEMIAQYPASPQQMEAIRARLATAFRKPAFPGGGCGVDSTLLFQILNELSINQTEHHSDQRRM